MTIAITKIIRCRYCKNNVVTGKIHDCQTGRRQSDERDAYYDGSCLLGSVFGLSGIDDSCSGSDSSDSGDSCISDSSFSCE